MIALSAHTKVYLAKDATDMRKSFRGLILLTEAVLRQEPASGHLFVFLNRRRDLMKILYWDGTGFCIWYKKFESHYPHFLLFTGIGKFRDNLAHRPAAAVGMDSGPPRIGPRRRPMPGQIAVTVPPRAEFAAGP